MFGKSASSLNESSSRVLMSAGMTLLIMLMIIVGAFEFFTDKTETSDTSLSSEDEPHMTLGTSHFIFWLVAFALVILGVFKLIEFTTEN